MTNQQISLFFDIWFCYLLLLFKMIKTTKYEGFSIFLDFLERLNNIITIVI